MEIQEVLKKLSIHQVLKHYGIKMNRNKMVCCSFHDDKNLSMQVYQETNTVFYFSGNHHGKIKNCIIFPLKDKQKNIVSFESLAGRSGLGGSRPLTKVQGPNVVEGGLLFQLKK